jgi:soluble lytic murein transglycosylase-like protein
MRRVLAAVVLAVVIMTLNLTYAHARDYTSDDTLAAIEQYSNEYQVSYSWLYRIVRCETGWTFNPYAVGRQGELGAAQLHPHGELRRFYSWGYDDPFSPYQSVAFLAQRLSQGGARAWSCA